MSEQLGFEETAVEEAAPEVLAEVAPPAPPPEPVVAAKPALDASRALAARAAKEREFRQQEQAVKKERAELEVYKAEVAEARELARLAKEDPLTFLEKTGHSFEKMGADLITGKRPGLADKAWAAVEELKAEIAKRDAADEARNVDKMYDDTKQDVTSYVTAKAAEYDLINQIGAHEDVFDEVQRHYEETGEIDVDGAAQRVEAYLESMLEKSAKSQKARKFFPSDATAPAAKPATLTNQSAATITSRDKAPQTDEELFAAAIAHL